MFAGCRAHDAAPTGALDAAAPSATQAAATPAATPPTTACVVRRDYAPSATSHGAVTELTVDLARCRVVPVVGEHLTTLDALAPKEALAGINGGFFDASGHALGLRRIANVESVPPWTKPTGGVVAFDANRLFIGPRAQMPNTSEWAVQCKPLLVENDGQSGIRTDDGRRAARTTVCDTGDGALHIVLFFAGAVVAASPAAAPTLYETAERLRLPRDHGGFGCRAALNLDGGPSTGVWLSAGGSRLPHGPVADGLFVVPR